MVLSIFNAFSLEIFPNAQFEPRIIPPRISAGGWRTMDASMEESGSVSADDEVPNEFSPESLTSSESGWQGWHHPDP